MTSPLKNDGQRTQLFGSSGSQGAILAWGLVGNDQHLLASQVPGC